MLYRQSVWDVKLVLVSEAGRTEIVASERC